MSREAQGAIRWDHDYAFVQIGRDSQNDWDLPLDKWTPAMALAHDRLLLTADEVLGALGGKEISLRVVLNREFARRHIEAAGGLPPLYASIRVANKSTSE